MHLPRFPECHIQNSILTGHTQVMPLRGDYRLKQVAKRANISERTARRWRDSNDWRWKRYLNDSTEPFSGLTVPDITLPPITPTPAAQAPLHGFEVIDADDGKGDMVETATFSKQQAVEALEHLRALTFRLADLLAKDPPMFEGIASRDFVSLDDCAVTMQKLAAKYGGKPLKSLKQPPD